MKKCCFYILPFGILLMSCKGNSSMHFDSENQCVGSEDGQILTNVVLVSSDNAEIYFFRKKNGKNGTSCFNFENLSPDYELEGNFGEPLVNFKLKPSSEYTFTNHTIGDAASSEITFETDSLGKVFRAFPTK